MVVGLKVRRRDVVWTSEGKLSTDKMKSLIECEGEALEPMSTCVKGERDPEVIISSNAVMAPVTRPFQPRLKVTTLTMGSRQPGELSEPMTDTSLLQLKDPDS